VLPCPVSKGFAGGPPPFAPQYPPPAHNSLNFLYIYGPTTGFSPVSDDFRLQLSIADAETPLMLSLVDFRVASAVRPSTCAPPITSYPKCKAIGWF
jgi:hypothetical protein